MNSGHESTGHSDCIGGSVLAEMEAGETAKVQIYIDAGGATIDIAEGSSIFTGFLVC
jgi:hypothetical protein